MNLYGEVMRMVSGVWSRRGWRPLPKEDGVFEIPAWDTDEARRTVVPWWGVHPSGLDAGLVWRTKAQPAGWAMKRAQACCKRGHPLSGIRKSDGTRYCSECARIRAREYYRLVKAGRSGCDNNDGGTR